MSITADINEKARSQEGSPKDIVSIHVLQKEFQILICVTTTFNFSSVHF